MLVEDVVFWMRMRNFDGRMLLWFCLEEELCINASKCFILTFIYANNNIHAYNGK